MEKTILIVEGMSCEHCVRAVTNAVGALDGVGAVDVDLAAKTVTVTRDAAKAAIDDIKFAIEEEGYEVVGA
ncbi:MAG: copper ion binding protein [Clostridiales Family XIII bacterium]|jgi:copper chaperone|nr:copper ion binding protein [Clostridiales Family XIII bacterium]